MNSSDSESKGIIICFIITLIIGSFFGGYALGVKKDTTVTVDDVTDNIEYLLYSDDYQYSGYVNKLKLSDIRSAYAMYGDLDMMNIKGNNMARMALKNLAAQMCFTKMDKDIPIDKIPINGTVLGKPIGEVMRCVIDAEGKD